MLVDIGLWVSVPLGLLWFFFCCIAAGAQLGRGRGEKAAEYAFYGVIGGLLAIMVGVLWWLVLPVAIIGAGALAIGVYGASRWKVWCQWTKKRVIRLVTWCQKLNQED